MGLLDVDAVCEECGVEFDCKGHWDEEHHDGYGTRREWFPDEDMVCNGCKGRGQCEGTFRDLPNGRIETIKCSSDDGTTYIGIEDNGSKTRHGVYCKTCLPFWKDDE